MTRVLDPLTGFLAHHLVDIRGVHCSPAVFLQIHFRATMLRALETGRVTTQLFVAKRAGGEPKTVSIPRRYAGGPAKPHEQSVDIGAFPAQIAGFEQRLDIADPAPAHFRLSISADDDPVIDPMDLVDIGMCTLCDL